MMVIRLMMKEGVTNIVKKVMAKTKRKTVMKKTEIKKVMRKRERKKRLNLIFHLRIRVRY